MNKYIQRMGRGCTSADDALNGEGVHKCGVRTTWGWGAQGRWAHYMGTGCTSAVGALHGDGVHKGGGRTKWVGGAQVRVLH
jgi:hypothetical protein